MSQQPVNPFRTEGSVDVKITDVRAAKCRYKTEPPAFDVVFDLTTRCGHRDTYAIECSHRVVTGGRHRGKQQAQALTEDLAKLGYSGRLIVSEIAAGLVGTVCTALVGSRETDGKIFWNVTWLGPKGAGRAEEIPVAQADAYAAQMFGYQLTAQAAAPSPAPSTQPVAAQPVAAQPVEEDPWG